MATHFDAAFAELQEAAGLSTQPARGGLSVKQYEGPDGVRVVCQESFHHNFDLTHEHWGEVIAPELDVAAGGDECDVFRSSTDLAFVHLVLTGDKAAGKTTFLNALTTGDLRMLQCLRYESALFYNIWYAPSTADLVALRGSLNQRELPFFQTELAHGGMLMEAAELRFFLEDEEFLECCGSGCQGVTPATDAVLAESVHVLVKLLELGGDCLHELLALDMEEAGDAAELSRHPVKVALMRQASAAVRIAARVAYFVNLTSLFGSDSNMGAAVTDTADATGPEVLVTRLHFLRRLIREDAEVLFFCTQPPTPRLEEDAIMSTLSRRLSLPSTELPRLDPDGPDQLLQIVKWLALRSGFAPKSVQVFSTEHLQADVRETDHSAVLQSLRRLLGGDCLSTSRSALPLLAEQVAYLLLDEQTAVVDKDILAELLQGFDDGGHVELYRKVLHPMVVVPPMVFLDAFMPLMKVLSTRGLVCPATSTGEMALEIEVDIFGAENVGAGHGGIAHAAAATVLRMRPGRRPPHLRVGSADSQALPQSTADGGGEEQIVPQPPCWRVIVQSAVVAEARRFLNLCQHQLLLDSNDSHVNVDKSSKMAAAVAAARVSASAAVAILSEGWAAAAAAWAANPTADAFSELYLAARFLLCAGHEPLPATCGFAIKWNSGDDCESDSIVLQAPLDSRLRPMRLGDLAKQSKASTCGRSSDDN